MLSYRCSACVGHKYDALATDSACHGCVVYSHICALLWSGQTYEPLADKWSCWWCTLGLFPVRVCHSKGAIQPCAGRQRCSGWACTQPCMQPWVERNPVTRAILPLQIPPSFEIPMNQHEKIKSKVYFESGEPLEGSCVGGWQSPAFILHTWSAERSARKHCPVQDGSACLLALGGMRWGDVGWAELTCCRRPSLALLPSCCAVTGSTHHCVGR